MREPFHQTILMDIFDTTTALARVEQRFLWCSFASTYSTNALHDWGHDREVRAGPSHTAPALRD
jgi:hypothetical protein